MDKPLIYSVEDDESIRELLECTMDASGFTVVTFVDAESMIATLENKKCDLILLDIMLPKMDGIEALKIVKQTYPEIPVIMLSAKGSELNKVKGLDAGADDYISKPFGILELIARIKARLRKRERIDFNGIMIDTSKYLVTVDGEEVKLTAKEFDVLRILMSRVGSVIKREVLLAELWGDDFDGETRTVDMHIMSLRSKLGDKGGLIRTVRGVGYTIDKG